MINLPAIITSLSHHESKGSFCYKLDANWGLGTTHMAYCYVISRASSLNRSWSSLRAVAASKFKTMYASGSAMNDWIETRALGTVRATVQWSHLRCLCLDGTPLSGSASWAATRGSCRWARAQLKHAALVWGTLRAGYSCLEMVIVSLINLVEHNACHWVLLKILQLFLDPLDTLLGLIAHYFYFFVWLHGFAYILLKMSIHVIQKYELQTS